MEGASRKGLSNSLEVSGAAIPFTRGRLDALLLRVGESAIETLVVKDGNLRQRTRKSTHTPIYPSH